MIKSSLSFPTPITQSPLRSTKRACNSALALLAALSALGASGCTGRNIHSDLREDPKILVRKWTLMTSKGAYEATNRGYEYSNALMVENTLVFGSRNVGVVALYPGINQQRWVLPIAGGVVSEIGVDKGTLYFGGGDGFLYSVNLENGRVNWRYDVRNPLISRPTVAENRVFVTTTDDTVYAFDASTGKWLWHYRRRSSQTATILGASAPLVDNGEVIAGLSDGFLVALNLQDGSIKWEKKLHTGIKFTDVDAHPVLENGILYEPSYDGALYALKRQSGDIVWRFDAGGSKDVVLEGERVYLPSSDGNVYALSKASAKVLWKFELDKGAPTRLVVTDRYIIVGSSFQYLYVIDKETGNGLYRYNVGNGSGFSSAPAYDAAAHRFYILSQGGNLYSFAVRQLSGKVWKFPGGQTDGYTFYKTSSLTEP
ncbi:MAG: outer membrane protein assembly factor BamB family protein [Bdellovibrionota bacterium]